MNETQREGSATAAELKIAVTLMGKLADFTKCGPAEWGLWLVTKPDKITVSKRP